MKSVLYELALHSYVLKKKFFFFNLLNECNGFRRSVVASGDGNLINGETLTPEK